MAVFEFVSITCVEPSEVEGDEVFVDFNGVKVFPGAERSFHRFKKGTQVVNTEARYDSVALQSLTEGDDTTALADIPGADALARHAIKDTGLLIRVMEHDLMSSDDVLGRILVPDRSENGLQKRRLEGDGGHYVLSFLVHSGVS
jgi:hypothetical protein